MFPRALQVRIFKTEPVGRENRNSESGRETLNYVTNSAQESGFTTIGFGEEGK